MDHDPSSGRGKIMDAGRNNLARCAVRSFGAGYLALQIAAIAQGIWIGKSQGKWWWTLAGREDWPHNVVPECAAGAAVVASSLWMIQGLSLSWRGRAIIAGGIGAIARVAMPRVINWLESASSAFDPLMSVAGPLYLLATMLGWAAVFFQFVPSSESWLWPVTCVALGLVITFWGIVDAMIGHQGPSSLLLPPPVLATIGCYSVLYAWKRTQRRAGASDSEPV